MAIITYRRPGCPNCQHYLRTGWPKFGPAQVKCGYCGTILTTGLEPWATLSTGRRVLIAIWELLLPTLGGNPGVNLLFSLLAWASLIGIALVVLRLLFMISQSDAYSRTGLPPTWKYMSTQLPSIVVPAPDSPAPGTDRAAKRPNDLPEPTPGAGIVDQPESLMPHETIADSAPAVQDAVRKPSPASSDELPLPEKPAHPATSVAQVERQDQPAKHVSAAQTSPSHKPRAKSKASIVIIGAVALPAICVLLPICVVAGIMLLNPAMSNTFSDINAGLNPLQPKLEINTTVGALVVSKIEFAGSLPPGCSPGPTCNQPRDSGRQFLILWLERKGSGRIKDIKDSLFQAVRDNPGKAYVTTSDGYRAELAAVFFEDPRFALGFVVPMGAPSGITLNWPNNPTIALGNPLGGPVTTPTPTFTGRITPAPPPTTAPIVRSGVAQPGHWEGSPGVSFDVTADGKIRNFRLAASDVQCTLKIDEVSVKPDGTFELDELIEERNYWPGADREALKAKNVWPTPVMTEKGAMIEAQRIDGKFTNPTTLTGFYKILACGNQQIMLAEGKGVYRLSAEWKGRAQTPVSTSTPAIPTARPMPSSTAPSTPQPSPLSGHWEGNPLVSFDVTVDGKIQNFRMVAPFGVISNDYCTVSGNSEIVLSADGEFMLGSLTPQPAYLKGKLTEAKSFTGTYMLAICRQGGNTLLDDYARERTWNAEWKGPTQISGTPENNRLTPPPTLIAPRTAQSVSPTPTPTGNPTVTRASTATPTATTLPAPALRCGNPNAQITSPGMNQKIRGIVPFMGSADIPDFLYYKIQFMPESSYGTDKWGQLYQGKSPVPATGKLMEWHTYTVEPGAYWMRLIVADRTGNYPDPCEIRVQVER